MYILHMYKRSVAPGSCYIGSTDLKAKGHQPHTRRVSCSRLETKLQSEFVQRNNCVRITKRAEKLWVIWECQSCSCWLVWFGLISTVSFIRITRMQPEHSQYINMWSKKTPGSLQHRTCFFILPCRKLTTNAWREGPRRRLLVLLSQAVFCH